MQASPALPAPKLRRLPDFARLWTSNLLGDVGASFASVALSITAVVALHASAFEVAVITALGNSAYLVLGIPVGVWADRVPPKRLLVVADVARFVAVATVPPAYLLHVLTVPHLMVVAAVTSAAGVVFEVAHTTALPPIVGRARVAEASASLQSVDWATNIIGPGIAGWLVGATSGPIAYLVTAAMHLGSSINALRITPARPANGVEHPPFWKSLGIGVAYIFRNVPQRTLVVAAGVINLGGGFVFAAYPIFALRTLHLTPQVYGIVLACGAAGGFVATFLAMPVRRLLGEVRAPIICYALLPLFYAPAPLALWLPVPPAVSLGTAEFLLYLVIALAVICTVGIHARLTPTRLFGRVTAARRTLMQGTMPLGTLLGGVLVTLVGADAVLWVGLGICLCGLPFYAPIIRHRDVPPEWDVADDPA